MHEGEDLVLGRERRLEVLTGLDGADDDRDRPLDDIVPQIVHDRLRPESIGDLPHTRLDDEESDDLLEQAAEDGDRDGLVGRPQACRLRQQQTRLSPPILLVAGLQLLARAEGIVDVDALVKRAKVDPDMLIVEHVG